jgi:hypothetical protein
MFWSVQLRPYFIQHRSHMDMRFAKASHAVRRLGASKKKPEPSGSGFSGQDGNAVRREWITAV